MSSLSRSGHFTAQTAITAAAIISSWTIVSWTFLTTSYPEGTPRPPLTTVQALLLVPGVLGLEIAKRVEPSIGQPVASFLALFLVVFSVAFAAMLSASLIRRRT
jgi:hypothetical protein